MSIKIALAGNPNCGKTTMFNDLTGSTQYVGNWPGVTVEKKEGKLIGHKKDVIVTDLPGIYSLSPYSPEEVVSRNYLLNERPDAILNLVDATNLERNLYLTTQLVEIGLPVVIALNMMDLVKKNGDRIDTKKLAAALGCEIVETSALKGIGSHEAAEKAVALAEAKKAAVPQHQFSQSVEAALAKIGELIAGKVPAAQLRWYSIKVFERDEKILEDLKLTDNAEIKEIVSAVEKEMDDDGESIITNERYEYIAELMKHCVHKKRSGMSISDKVDRIVTNRVLAIPIFVVVMFLVYYVSVTTVGTYVTDFTNDQLFGDDSAGWHLFKIGSADYDAAANNFGVTEAAAAAGVDVDAAAQSGTTLADAAKAQGVDLTQAVSDVLEKSGNIGNLDGLLNDDGEPDPAKISEAAAAVPITEEPNADDFGTDSDRYDTAVNTYALTTALQNAGVDVDAAAASNTSLADAAKAANVDLTAAVTDANDIVSASGSLDGVLNEDGDAPDPDAVAEASDAAPVTEAPDPADFGIWVPSIYHVVNLGMQAAQAPDWLSGLVLDGIVTGVGSVLGFVPQMFVLFFFLSILEDIGYMARVAFIMDRIFRQFGLSGKSFIPMLISSGCGVPGIMSTKTIENEHDRRMTIMTTTFVPCSAKLPIIALLFGALAGSQMGGWVAPLFYFLGVIAVIVSGIILKKTKPFSGDPAPFVMELPQYHVPAPKGILIHMWERVRSFIIKAGTVIFGAVIVIWFLSNFGWQSWAGGSGSFGMLIQDTAPSLVNVMDYSILGHVGQAIAFIFTPLGFGASSQWPAAVATITGLIAKENVVGTFGVLFGLGDGTEADPGMWAATQSLFGTQAAMVAFLAFNLLCAPCFAAMGAIKRQMESGKWFAFAILYECGFAYVIGTILYQLITLFTTGVFTGWTVLGFAFLALLVFLLVRPNPYEKERRLSSSIPTT